jgi:predicted acylesterase/phospholipase RssA
VDDYGIFDFLKADEIIELGYQEAVKMMPEIIERIQELKI